MADAENIAVVFAAAVAGTGVEMAPPKIQRVISAQGDVDAQFIAIGLRVHAIRSRRPAEGRRENRVGGLRLGVGG